MDGGGIVETGNLRHVAGNEIAPARELARIGLGHAGRDPQKGGFARAVATHEPDVFALG